MVNLTLWFECLKICRVMFQLLSEQLAQNRILAGHVKKTHNQCNPSFTSSIITKSCSVEPWEQSNKMTDFEDENMNTGWDLERKKIRGRHAKHSCDSYKVVWLTEAQTVDQQQVVGVEFRLALKNALTLKTHLGFGRDISSFSFFNKPDLIKRGIVKQIESFH